jgi:apolipoprotein N-acyltransferase
MTLRREAIVQGKAMTTFKGFPLIRALFRPRTQAHPTAPVLARPPAWPVLLLSLVSALFLNLAFFPFNIGWFGWFVLVPLLPLIRTEARPLKVYGIAYLAGLAFFVPILQWMRVADPRMYATWICLALYCAVYFVVAIGLLRWLERSTTLPLLLTLPVVWVGLEFARAHVITGFPWYFLAHTQHEQSRLIQVADLTGAYGISFLVAACNALFFEFLWQIAFLRRLTGCSKAPRANVRGLLVQSSVWVLVLTACLLYGGFRLGQDSQRPGPRLAMLQSSVPQGVRNEDSSPEGENRKKVTEDLWGHYLGLCGLAASYQPDLIVWPETSVPGGWSQLASNYPRGTTLPKAWPDHLEWSNRVAQAMSGWWHTPLLLGVNNTVLREDNREIGYNSALLLDARGQTQGRYDKIHRVPFGEYVPLREWIPWMDLLSPYDYDYGVAAGDGNPRLPVASRTGRPFHFGVTICYEDTDPSLNWVYGRGNTNTGYDFIVNISNDGWFEGTAEHEQHLAIARFRSIEVRRGMVRAANMGISAVIDGNGRVLRPQQIPLPQDVALLGLAARPVCAAAIPWLLLAKRFPVWDVPAGAAAEELPVAEWANYKIVPGVLLANIPIDRRSTFYASCGDWLPWGCWFFLGMIVVGRWFGFWRQR